MDQDWDLVSVDLEELKRKAAMLIYFSLHELV